MLRVISGSAKGRRLSCPPGAVTRPPTDLLKGAVFNILSDRVMGARVLDLFAGCGAFGIEALSRGAKTCVFVERDAAAVETLRRNLETAGFADRAVIARGEIERTLARRAVGGEERPDLIFADPPFGFAQTGEGRDAVARLARVGLACLAPRGTFVLRLLRRRKDPIDIPEPSDRRGYGDSEVLFYHV